MKKNILSMAVLLMASAAVFTACSSDDNITSEQPANPTGKYTMTVQASKDGDATTRALTLDETTSPHKLNATWDANEVVLVYQGGSQIGTLYSAASTTNETTLTGTLDSAPNAAQDLTLYFHTDATPSYDGQDGTLAKIASTYDFCAPATIATGNFTVKGNTASTSSSVSFGANQQSVVKFTLKDKNSEALLKAGTVRVQATYGSYGTIFSSEFNIPGDTYTTNGDGIIYLAIPTSSPLSTLATAIGSTTDAIKSYCRLNITATVGDNTYTYTKNGWPFDDGQYYEITVKMAEVLKPDLLSGVFSVSDSKKVKFSKGNLRYASGTWSFFNNQYGYYTSYSADAWDKFGWSTAATNYGMNTSKSNSTYSGNFVDWGSNSDLQTALGTGWFTLSSAESTYLFNTRSASTVGGTANGRYAKAKVNDVQGVILFPDTYTHPDGVTAPTGVNATGNTGWTGNTYNSTDWSKMESAGCVFLPAAGYRYDSSVDNAGTNGTYWSATPSDTDSSHYVSFNLNSLTPANSNSRYFGGSVRLVRQVTE